MRIDAHQHVWELARHPQPWMGPDERAVIGRDFSTADWAAEALPCGFTGSVVVQTVADPAETPDLLDVAAGAATTVGVVGWVAFDGDAADALDALREHPHGEWLVGVRDLTDARAEDGFLITPVASRAITAVGRRALTLDLLVRERHLPAVAVAAHAHPGTRMIVDHLAKPDLDVMPTDAWADLVRPVAHAPNVAVKFSGFATQVRDLDAAAVHVRDYLDAALTLFGPDRVMFGSDWPVCRVGAPYAAVVGAVEDAVERLAPAEREAFWWGTACDWYRLDAGGLR
jgi:L-fuconolactonase